MDSRSFTLPKGDYYFGDLRYVITNKKDWLDIFVNNQEGDWEYKNTDYLLFNSPNGWVLNHRTEIDEEGFQIESGTIGIISIHILDEAIPLEDFGLILNTDYELKVDIQGEEEETYGIHVYQKKDKYDFDDESILVRLDEDEFDEEYFISNCPPFEDGQEDRALIEHKGQDDEEEDEAYRIDEEEIESEVETIIEEIGEGYLLEGEERE